MTVLNKIIPCLLYYCYSLPMSICICTLL